MSKIISDKVFKLNHKRKSSSSKLFELPIDVGSSFIFQHPCSHNFCSKCNPPINSGSPFNECQLPKSNNLRHLRHLRSPILVGKVFNVLQNNTCNSTNFWILLYT